MLKRFSNKNLKPLSSFTLAELLIATLIFAIVAVIAASFFITVLRAHRRADLEDYLYSEARLMMEKIAKEISSGTIDYEEYYNKHVYSEKCEGGDLHYGVHYDKYGQRFWDPGNSISDKDYYSDCVNNNDLDINGFGSLCNDGSAYDGVCIRLRESMDINTGQNQYNSGNPENYNAFCYNDSDCNETAWAVEEPYLKELYLINNSGDVKTMIVWESTGDTAEGTPEYTISLVRMDGFDYGLDHDAGTNDDFENDDVIDSWSCTEEFSCTGLTIGSVTIPNFADVSSDGDAGVLHAQDFVPIIPLDLNVIEMEFIISPVEDPHKAFAENDVQIHPRVTIKLTVEAGEKIGQRIGGDPPKITLQTTVSTSVYRPIESFKPPL